MIPISLFVNNSDDFIASICNATSAINQSIAFPSQLNNGRKFTAVPLAVPVAVEMFIVIAILRCCWCWCCRPFRWLQFGQVVACMHLVMYRLT